MKLRFILLLSILTSLASFSQNPPDTILIDFGNDLSPFPWNNVTSPANGSVADLVNKGGFHSGIGIEVFDAFNGINNSGTTAAAPALGIPAPASGDSFFGNTVLFGNQIQPTGGVRLVNLDTSKSYQIEIFSSRLASDNRQTKYVVAGSSSDTLLLQVASNTDSIATTQLKPKADGSITITASPGPENNNSYGFFYLGAMKVIYEGEPSTQTPQLSLLWPNGGEYWQVGKSPLIAWQSLNLGLMTIEYSYDGGQMWQVVDTVFAAQQSYAWQVPPTPSQQCLVRLTADTIAVVSKDFFEIAEDTSTCRIVVIGSSTAAGAGASVPDSAWVNRYRTQVFQNNTRVEVANLAKGGYTTYHLLPTGTPIPPGISITIDEERNISKALSLEPHAVVVNLPSNDAANFFPAVDQLANFAAMQAAADSAGVELYICTTQPRNFSNPAQVAIQKEVRDSILSIYPDHALDFWTPIADSNGFILPQYNSGDGVHLNDAGHRLLAETVLEKGIHQTDCAPVINNTAGVNPEAPNITVYPNPIGEEVNVLTSYPGSYELHLELFNAYGIAMEDVTVDCRQADCSHTIRIPNKNANPGFYILKCSIKTQVGIHSKSIKLIRF